MISTAFSNILSDEILYTRKMKEKKKKKVTKKIGKKHSNYKTGKKAKGHKKTCTWTATTSRTTWTSHLVGEWTPCTLMRRRRRQIRQYG